MQGAEEFLKELSPSNKSKSTVPVGHWRDGLWDVCSHGPAHGSSWTACCCVPIAAAQVISRLHLTAWGRPHAVTHQRTAIFRIIVASVASFWCTRVLLFLIIAILDPNTDRDRAEWVEPGEAYYALCAFDDLLAYVYMVLCVVQLRNVRSYVRTAYAIPGSNAADVGCSVVCPCFVAAQLLRHTADYDTVSSQCCCSETGLPVNAPSIV